MFDDPRVQQRYATRAELDRAMRPLRTTDWLSESECAELARFRHPDRRKTWLAGRWLSKQLMTTENGCCVSGSGSGSGSGVSSASDASAYRAIEIRSSNLRGQGVRPTVSVGGRIQNWSLSISHSETAVLVALSQRQGVGVGVDLTPIQKCSSGFLKTWLTSGEQQQVRTAGPRRAVEVWAVKEAVYKASNRGESFAPRRIEVLTGPQGQFVCRYDGKSFPSPCEIWVKDIGQDIAAIAITQPQEKHDD